MFIVEKMENVLLSEFSASLSANNEVSERARDSLESISYIPGLVPLLMKISLEISHGEEVCQAAVNYLQNICKNWEEMRPEYAIPQPDKDYLKIHILMCLKLSIPEKIRIKFEEDS